MPYEKKMHQSLRPETEKRFAELESSPKHQRYNKQITDVLHRLNTFEKEVDPSQRDLIQAIITVLKHSQEYAQHLLKRVAHYEVSAIYDTKTVLPLRSYFNIRLKESIYEIIKQKTPLSLAVMYIDGDGLKSINDTHGHIVGDEFLQELSLLLTHLFKPGDTISRDKETGDEFLVLLHNYDQQAVAKKTQSVERAIRRHFRGKYSNHEVVGATIGYSFFSNEHTSKIFVDEAYVTALAQQMINNADAHMNLRKLQTGKRKR